MMIVHAIYLPKKNGHARFDHDPFGFFKYKFYQIYVSISNIILSEFDDLSYPSLNGELEFE